MLVTIGDLPNEILQHILYRLPAPSLLAVQKVCRGLSQTCDSLNWRFICQKTFKYWDPSDRLIRRFTSADGRTNWKQVLIKRHMINQHISLLIDDILSSQADRIDKFERILEYGYDAKDCLLQHMAVNEDDADCLARRFYTDAVLGLLHRVMAIKQWSKLKDLSEVSLEKALVSFDMFILHDRFGDFDEISSRLDRIVKDVLANNQYFTTETPRRKALLIVKHLLRHNLTGPSRNGESHYNDLHDNFMGLALQDNAHPSLPLISTAIFCCIAQRLGLNAKACGFPFHVVAVVWPPKDFDLDGRSTSSHENPKPMYLDPFQSDQEIPVEHLTSRLRFVGVPQASHAALLEASSVSEIVLRASRNIFSSVQDSHRDATARHGGRDQIFLLSSLPDLEGAFYSALWASLLLGRPLDQDGPIIAPVRRRNYLPLFVEHFETYFPMDVGVVEEFIIPLFNGFPESAQLLESVRVIRSVDAMPKQVKRRTEEISAQVKYKIGQVFNHKRYHYMAVITGWDVECGADEHWMAQMRVHELARGKHQSFYHVLVEDKSVRYVAEESIEIIRPEYPLSLAILAGRHFKRWDSRTYRFVSNIMDEYPDD